MTKDNSYTQVVWTAEHRTASSKTVHIPNSA